MLHCYCVITALGTHIRDSDVANPTYEPHRIPPTLPFRPSNYVSPEFPLSTLLCPRARQIAWHGMLGNLRLASQRLGGCD